MNKLTMMCMTAVLAGCSAAPIVAVGCSRGDTVAVGTGTWVIAAVIPKYLSQRLSQRLG